MTPEVRNQQLLQHVNAFRPCPHPHLQDSPWGCTEPQLGLSPRARTVVHPHPLSSIDMACAGSNGCRAFQAGHPKCLRCSFWFPLNPNQTPGTNSKEGTTPESSGGNLSAQSLCPWRSAPPARLRHLWSSAVWSNSVAA